MVPTPVFLAKSDAREIAMSACKVVAKKLSGNRRGHVTFTIAPQPVKIAGHRKWKNFQTIRGLGLDFCI